MDSSPAQPVSLEARQLFSGLLARVEAGEALDFEACFDAEPALAHELRLLHARWRRLDGLLSSLGADSEALDSAADVLRARRGAEPERAALAGEWVARAFEERYEQHGRLGRGGMGVVLRVWDRVLRREVAVKRLRRGDASSLRRFLDEARLVAGLDHPGIVPLHDAGLDARGRPWFTMPLVSGTSLAVVLGLARSGSAGWTRERALGVLLRVCETVAYAHARGIVHRDLKPANVMVGAFGEVHVLDWGLALLADEPAAAAARDTVAASSSAGSAPRGATRAHRTRHGTLLGTPAYMPPEQAAGRRDLVGPASDVYALGAILYQLLSGRAPYAELGHSNDAAARGVLAGPPVALALVAREAPSELVAICEKAMARDIDARYADMRALADDLRAFLEGRVVRAHESGAWAELRKWIGRNRALAGALALVALLGGLALALGLWSERARHSEIVRLADARRLAQLAAREEALDPALPERFAAFEGWLAESESLLARRAVHKRDLEELRARSQSGTRFDSEEDAWRFEALTALVAGLDSLSGLRDGTRARLERARLVREQTLVRRTAEWEQVRGRLARPGGPYPGLELRPQFGLVPLGSDPASGLELFADLRTGRLPAWGAAEGPRCDAESALVFVLVPAGRARLGSRRWDPADRPGEEGDRMAREHELPRLELELAPFFLARSELSQAQWARLAGLNPSYLPVEHAADPASRALHPVDTVSWVECSRVLARAGLALPTEAQWEYAARAGSETAWWCGAEAAALAGKVNAALDGELPAGRGSRDVLAGPPNPWGFLHILGNVAEWTRDAYSPGLAGPRRAGDGEALVDGSALRVVRGGSFLSRPPELRCAARDEQAPGTRSAWIGVRPARPLDP